MMVKTRREIKREEEEMASMPSPVMAMPGALENSSRPIPLVCSVCPNAPNFSDSSHLLTHIASKGHLHHETQTKLRAHQDLAASYALQQYEQWYRDNNIETLLVDRLKAKQDKEAARVRRGRGAASSGPARQQARKKPRRSNSNSPFIKTEQDAFAANIPSMFPPFGQTDQDSEFIEDFLPCSDMVPGDTMSLKGQVYPGMGKMDLANDEMKRTRNQRKPKSVVERMRRTSEGIGSVQYVMTPDFEVERVKDVYDDESPVEEDDDESPPRKVTRTRRRKVKALANLSTNVPRMANGRVSRETSTSSGTASRPVLRSNQYMGGMTTPMGVPRPTFDVFRDDDSKSAFDGAPMAPQPKREPRCGDQFAMQTLNPFSHSNVSSPSPAMRDIPQRMAHGKDPSRSRFQAHPYYNGAPVSFNSFSRNEGETIFHDPAIYHGESRFPYMNAGYAAAAQDQYRMHLPTIKQDQYSPGIEGEAMGNQEPNLFLNFPNASPNPLLPQERAFLGTYQPASTHQSISPMGFTPINGSRDYAYTAAHGHDFGQQTPSNIKLETQTHPTLGSEHSSDDKDRVLESNGTWDLRGSEDDLPLENDEESRGSSA